MAVWSAFVASASCVPIDLSDTSSCLASSAATAAISAATWRAIAPPSRAVLRPIRSFAWMPVVPS